MVFGLSYKVENYENVRNSINARGISNTFIPDIVNLVGSKIKSVVNCNRLWKEKEVIIHWVERFMHRRKEDNSKYGENIWIDSDTKLEDGYIRCNWYQNKLLAQITFPLPLTIFSWFNILL